MAASFFKADKDVLALVESVRNEFHPDLQEAKAEATVLFAVARIDEKTGEPSGPALKHGGYPAVATIKIAGPKERAIGCKDVLLLIDSSEWDDLSQEQRIALLDHEWAHIEVVRDTNGQLVTNDDGYVKLRSRKHDWQIGGFNDVVARHKDVALELCQIAAVIGQDESPVKKTLQQLSLFE